MGEKASDRWVVPLCREHHDQQHRIGELAFWSFYKIDSFALALALHHASGDSEIAEVILGAHHRKMGKVGVV